MTDVLMQSKISVWNHILDLQYRQTSKLEYVLAAAWYFQLWRAYSWIYKDELYLNIEYAICYIY